MGFSLDTLVIQILHGLTLASIYILLASGLSVTFGLMKVLNFAHGALYMMGAYLGFVVIAITGNFFLALLIAPTTVAIIGIGMELATFRPLYGRDPIYHILLTFGLTMVFDEMTHIIWGPHIYSIDTPAMLKGSVNMFGQPYPIYRIFVLLFGGGLTAGLWLFLNKTKLGLIVRAGTYDAEMVNALGINISTVFTFTFAVGSALAALSGVVMGPFLSLYPGMGLSIIVIAIVIIIVGGVGNFMGAVIGALIIAEVQSISFLFYSKMSGLLIYAIMFLILIIRPQGILGVGHRSI